MNDSPRASTTQPPTLEILAELGLIDEYIAQSAWWRRTFQFWDRPTLRLIAEFDFERLRGETDIRSWCRPSSTSSPTWGSSACGRCPMPRCAWGRGSRALRRTRSRSTRRDRARGSSSPTTSSAATAARSTVRKSLGIEFEGYTWPERFLVITTKFDFAAALGCCFRNYMADPDEWTNLFKVAGDDLKGRWRAVYNTREDETDEEALSDAAVRARLRAHPRARERSATTCTSTSTTCTSAWRSNFRKGRVFLCGDAAHVNNPIGGLGLNSGIHEAWDLAQLSTGREGRGRPR